MRSTADFIACACCSLLRLARQCAWSALAATFLLLQVVSTVSAEVESGEFTSVAVEQIRRDRSTTTSRTAPPQRLLSQTAGLRIVATSPMRLTAPGHRLPNGDCAPLVC